MRIIKKKMEYFYASSTSNVVFHVMMIWKLFHELLLFLYHLGVRIWELFLVAPHR